MIKLSQNAWMSGKKNKKKLKKKKFLYEKEEFITIEQIHYNFFDGKNHMEDITVERGDTIQSFLDQVRRVY